MCDHGNFDGFDWEDIAIACSLAERLAAEERERQWLLTQVEPEDEEDCDP